MKAIYITATAALLAIASASAEPIKLKTGEVIDGTDLTIVPAIIQFTTPQGKREIPWFSTDADWRIARFPEARENKALIEADRMHALMDQSAKTGDEALSIAKDQSERLNQSVAMLRASAEQLRAGVARVRELEEQNAALRAQLAQSGIGAVAAAPAPGREIPASVLSRIKASASKNHPGDFSTQEYVIKNQIAAWQELQAMRPNGGVRSQVEAQAARDHPDDYSTQLYLVKQQLGSFRRLNVPDSEKPAVADPMKPENPSSLKRR